MLLPFIYQYVSLGYKFSYNNFLNSYFGLLNLTKSRFQLDLPVAYNFSTYFHNLENSYTTNGFFLSYGLHSMYDSISFRLNQGSGYTKNFEFFILKFTSLLTKRGLYLKALNLVKNIYLRLLSSNLVHNKQHNYSVIYFSDPFFLIIPAVQVVQRAVGKRSSRAIAVPKVLYSHRRIPRLLNIFVQNSVSAKSKQNSYSLVNKLINELLETRDLKSTTYRSISELYKSSIANLQFTQSLSQNMLFDFQSRLVPTSTKNKRKRVRLRNDFFYF